MLRDEWLQFDWVWSERFAALVMLRDMYEGAVKGLLPHRRTQLLHLQEARSAVLQVLQWLCCSRGSDSNVQVLVCSCSVVFKRSVVRTAVSGFSCGMLNPVVSILETILGITLVVISTLHPDLAVLFVAVFASVGFLSILAVKNALCPVEVQAAKVDPHMGPHYNRSGKMLALPDAAGAWGPPAQGAHTKRIDRSQYVLAPFGLVDVEAGSKTLLTR